MAARVKDLKQLFCGIIFLVTGQFKLLSVNDFEQESPSDWRATEQRCDK